MEQVGESKKSLNVSPVDIFVYLNSCYGFDISSKSRKREIVYAKKIFCYLCKQYGYGPSVIGRTLGLQHDNVIYHIDTITSVTPINLHHYNCTIDYFNLPLAHISSVYELLHGPVMASIIDKLKTLSPKDLIEFKRAKVEPFFLLLKKEKEIKEMGNG